MCTYSRYAEQRIVEADGDGELRRNEEQEPQSYVG